MGSMMRSVSIVALGIIAIAARPVQATTVFTENFNGETPALSASLSQFAVTGSVDVVAPINPFGITVAAPASGNVLDIDGTGAAGLITTIASFAFNAGDNVRLAFDLGGSQRGDVGDTFVTSFLFGNNTGYNNLSGTGLYSGLSGSGSVSDLENSLFVSGATPFTSSSISFLAQNAGTLKFAFSSPSQDNIGPLLDNISLQVTPVTVSAFSSNPEPSTWVTMLLGFGLIGGVMRKASKVPSVRLNIA
jgi:hypothetical protein